MRYISDVISAVEARKVTIEKALAQGTASNFDGEYAGLQTTIDIINNLLKEEEEKEL